MMRWVAIVTAMVAGLAATSQRIVIRNSNDPDNPSSNVVTNASNLSFQHANLTDVAGYTVDIDGTSDVDIFVPGQAGAAGSQAVLGGGGITFTFPVSSLSLANGAHTLTICAYNTGGTLSASCPTIEVTKQ